MYRRGGYGGYRPVYRGHRRPMYRGGYARPRAYVRPVYVAPVYGYSWYHPYYTPVVLGGHFPMYGVYICGTIILIIVILVVLCIVFESVRCCCGSDRDPPPPPVYNSGYDPYGSPYAVESPVYYTPQPYPDHYAYPGPYRYGYEDPYAYPPAAYGYAQDPYGFQYDLRQNHRSPFEPQDSQSAPEKKKETRNEKKSSTKSVENREPPPINEEKSCGKKKEDDKAKVNEEVQKSKNSGKTDKSV